jgi:hypothetical protein
MWMASSQTGGPHEPPDPLAPDPYAAHDEFGPDPAYARVAVQLSVDLSDLVGELLVGAVVFARAIGQPPVVALVWPRPAART